MLRLCVSVLLLVSGVSGEAREPDWGFQSYLDEDYTLSCNHTSLMPDPYNAVKWELPDGALMDRGTEKYMLSNGDTVINMHLTIKNVQEMDKGVYMCHVYQTYNMAQREYRGRLLRGLNIGGHKYRDPFDEYRYNLMVGGLAAVALFVPLVTVCFVYKFRFQVG
ncbi:hypothetical protein BaRGS_00012217 [Batillaria attramentaria]|uniref:Ig-like domain-containing protein n=1 Tax=Batillaria attramentaria TaxID=370345 RepID=A0ABD0LB25_9CAEN